MSPTEPGTLVPDALTFHCSVERWLSSGSQCSVGRPPTGENGQCVDVPPLDVIACAVGPSEHGISFAFRVISREHI